MKSLSWHMLKEQPKWGLCHILSCWRIINNIAETLHLLCWALQWFRSRNLSAPYLLKRNTRSTEVGSIGQDYSMAKTLDPTEPSFYALVFPCKLWICKNHYKYHCLARCHCLVRIPVWLSSMNVIRIVRSPRKKKLQGRVLYLGKPVEVSSFSKVLLVILESFIIQILLPGVAGLFFGILFSSSHHLCLLIAQGYRNALAVFTFWNKLWLNAITWLNQVTLSHLFYTKQYGGINVY